MQEQNFGVLLPEPPLPGPFSQFWGDTHGMGSGIRPGAAPIPSRHHRGVSAPSQLRLSSSRFPIFSRPPPFPGGFVGAGLGRGAGGARPFQNILCERGEP